MAEHLIAIVVGLVVGGGILTLVWRILTGDREQKAMESALDQFAKPEAKAVAGAKSGGKKK